MMKTQTDQQNFARIEHAIHWLTENYQDQPSLASAAEEVGLSEFHFQRLFSQWAGVSPKKFLQYLTLSHAKQRLAESDSVLDAAYDAGLSGPSRLHDLFVTHEGVSPGEWKAMGEGLTLRYGWHDSPFGDCLVVATDRGVCGLGFALGSDRVATEQDLLSRWDQAALVEDMAATAPLAALAFGEGEGPLHLVLRGTPFQLKVWEALMHIPPGGVISYERLATHIGKPGAARAVAGAVALNPVSWIVPCHRVIRGTGAITGYRWGPSRKRMMLGWEAAAGDRAS
ncbi:MAG: methylated-DNA--[protein]-cysteine S-methyltransferase [Alphaproteobacteria bacterium]|nr:methylated-DNA--[protein]-cysteine S-methyltransferase [Alphaproteobacteria bacterium]